MPTTGRIFQSDAREADITRAITRSWAEQFDQMIQSEVLIVGAGPSGLTCAWHLAKQGIKVVVVEQANHLGGGFWNGGYLANKAAIRKPADRVLDELNVPHTDGGQGVAICDPPHATAALIAACYAAGARFLNLTVVRDVIWREGRIEGLVVNWAPLYAMPYGTAHVDPIPLESYVVVDATGHDASVVNILAKREVCPKPPGNGAMWIEESEEEVVKRTGELLPNLWVCGLAVAAVHGTPRMGPAFGAMLLSGERAAEQITAKLRRPVTSTAAAKPASTPPMTLPPLASGGVSVHLPAAAPTPVAPTRSFSGAGHASLSTTPPGGHPAITTGLPPIAPSVGTRAFPPGTGAQPGVTPPAGTPALSPAMTRHNPAAPTAPMAQPPQTPIPSAPAVVPGRPAATVQKPAADGIPTVNPETGRWTRGGTSKFLKKKPE